MDPVTGLRESMWHLRLEPDRDATYPVRPGEPDCSYYVRTGSCGFGDRCRFNHPRDQMQVREADVDFPERIPCQYFLKTGTCKYGASCKYNHPKQASEPTQSVSLNYYGYPFRPGEKECLHYVRTGECKFGSSCKYHHPNPDGVLMPSPALAIYPTVQAPTMTSWQVARPAIVSSPYMQPAYGSMLVSPGVVPVTSWSPYPPVQTQKLDGSSNQLSPSAPAYPGPEQSECEYYMRTGECKFGSSCKYHHPPDRSNRINSGLNPVGLPLRPGTQPCSFYTQHGVCKFGPTCKFDHPTVLRYSPSASSLTDIPVVPYPIGFSANTLAPSNNDSHSTEHPSSESTPSASSS